MRKDLITFNNTRTESRKESFHNPEDLLKQFLKLNNITSNDLLVQEPDSVKCCDEGCSHCKPVTIKSDQAKHSTKTNNETDISNKPKVKQTKSNSTDKNTIKNTSWAIDEDEASSKPVNSPDKTEQPESLETGEVADKIIKLKATREKYNQSKSPDLNLLNEYLPYRASIKDNSEKLKKYDDLIAKILQKAQLQMSEEEFDKNTKLSDLTKLKPMDSFLSNLIAGSIVEIYHNREDLIDNVLDRPQGFTLVALKRKKDSGAVGLFESNKNFILADGTSVIMGMLNFKGKNNATEQLNIIGHEFTHAIDVTDSVTNIASEKDKTKLARNKDEKAEKASNDKATNDVKDNSQYKADGLLPGMTNKDKEIIEAALKEIKENNKDIEDYAKTDIQEFLATTMGETFIDNPHALKDGSSALNNLYAMYKNYLQFDPIEEEEEKIAA